jgi:hypothetical protein
VENKRCGTVDDIICKVEFEIEDEICDMIWDLLEIGEG